MDEMKAVSEAILGRKIEIKNSNMENWCKTSASVKKF